VDLKEGNEKLVQMMKAALVFGRKDVRVIDVPKPTLGPGEVLVKVKLCMTSGTTVKEYERPYPGLGYPHGFGYEWAGDVDEVGEGVDKSLIGKRCIFKWPSSSCSCFFCLRGQPNLCAKIKSKGYGAVHVDNIETGDVSGAFKQYVKFPVAQLRILPEHLSSDDACMIIYVTFAQHGNSNVDIHVGDTVAVIGAGAMGIIQMMLSHLRGAQTIAIDPVQSRLDFAAKVGAADHTINTGNTADAKKKLDELNINEGFGPDVVMEAVGRPQTYEEAIALARRGGQVLLYAGCEQGTSITVETYRLHYEEIRIVGSMHASLIDYERAYNLVERGVIKPSIFISRRFPLERIKEAHELQMKGEGVKFAVIP
jgi:L-iditol 2-dehydrogenase